MLVVFGGVQPGRTASHPDRFPSDLVDDVSARVRDLLAGLAPRLVVGGAAAGGDLVVIGAAREAGLTLRIVLPFSPERFRETSVAPAGEEWERRYDQLVAAGVPITDLGEHEDDDVYRRANGRLLAEAEAELTGGEELVVLVLRPAGDSHSSVTDDLADRATSHGRRVLDVDTTRRTDDLPTT